MKTSKCMSCRYKIATVTMKFLFSCNRINEYHCNDFVTVVTNCCIRSYQTLFFCPHTIKESLVCETTLNPALLPHSILYTSISVSSHEYYMIAADSIVSLARAIPLQAGEKVIGSDCIQFVHIAYGLPNDIKNCHMANY